VSTESGLSLDQNGWMTNRVGYNMIPILSLGSTINKASLTACYTFMTTFPFLQLLKTQMPPSTHHSHLAEKYNYSIIKSHNIHLICTFEPNLSLPPHLPLHGIRLLISLQKSIIPIPIRPHLPPKVRPQI